MQTRQESEVVSLCSSCCCITANAEHLRGLTRPLKCVLRVLRYLTGVS